MEIRRSAIAFRRRLLDHEDAVRIACRHVDCPHVREQLKKSVQLLHQEADQLRGLVLEQLNIEPITDDELAALGCPPGVKC